MIRGRLSCIARGRPILEILTGCVQKPIARTIAASSPAWAKKMPDRPQPLDESDFTEAFLKGSGPGGQKINKTSSAVQLKHIPTGMVLKVQATRSRTQNRKIARQMLAERVEELEKGKESRVAVIGETKKKRKSSAVKKSKRKYRLLDEAKSGVKEIKEDNAEKGLGPGQGEERG
ncbi:RF-1 domain-containing protein [Leptodontidium sp. MPI-SDFR-AT-0119]|nr:RF-1 domain-containing protein [Leptodontidium sp. MPI-SDFR-AT-0119]